MCRKFKVTCLEEIDLKELTENRRVRRSDMVQESGQWQLKQAGDTGGRCGAQKSLLIVSGERARTVELSTHSLYTTRF